MELEDTSTDALKASNVSIDRKLDITNMENVSKTDDDNTIDLTWLI